jgi:hypothetical protein
MGLLMKENDIPILEENTNTSETDSTETEDVIPSNITSCNEEIKIITKLFCDFEENIKVLFIYY